jgi:hypothetical protein
MKEVSVPELELSSKSLPHAFDQVFGLATLVEVHGPTLQATDFSNVDSGGPRTRQLQFEIDVNRVPCLIRCFFCGPKLRVSTDQRLETDADEWRVHNTLTLHFLGSELFSVRPVFWLKKAPVTGVITVGGSVQHSASLLPPFKQVAEHFMARHSERELRKFEAVLKSRNRIIA